MLINLVLLYALAQSPQRATPALPPSHQLALIFSDTDTRLMRLDEAERAWRKLRRRNTDPRLFAALTQALGVRTEVPHVNDVRARLDWEVRRGVRLPIQRKG